MHNRLAFDCKCSNVGIRHQVRAAADSVENVLQVSQVIRSRVKRLDMGVLKPTLYTFQGL